MSRPRVTLIANSGAGTTGRDSVERAVESLKGECDARVIWCEDGGDLVRLAKEAAASRPSAVIAVGGDGTVGAIASALVGGDVPLGVLPLGSLNHFAKDLGMPLDVEPAALVAATGPVRRVDVGLAGDRMFLNTACFGAYFRVVHLREQWRPRLGKYLAQVIAGFTVLFQQRHEARFELESFAGVRACSFAWIGNGEYRLDWPELGTRERMDADTLTVVMPRGAGRLPLLTAAFHVAIGHVQDSDSIDASQSPSAIVRVGSRSHGSLHAVLDGEICQLPQPVEISVKRAALLVRSPERGLAATE